MSGEDINNRFALDHESVCTDIERILEDIVGTCGQVLC